jgi:hypothetical protein
VGEQVALHSCVLVKCFGCRNGEHIRCMLGEMSCIVTVGGMPQCRARNFFWCQALTSPHISNGNDQEQNR